MNWVESTVVLALIFFGSVYLILVVATSPGKQYRDRKNHRRYRSSGSGGGIDSLRPRKLQGVRDEDLAEHVRNRLRLRPGLSGVEISVQDGLVHLSGRVGSTDERELAGNLARSVPQVALVVNEVRVKARIDEAVA